MKVIAGLFLVVLVACQQPSVQPSPSASQDVEIAVGAGGSIARSLDHGQTWEVVMSNPNLLPSKIIQGDFTFAGNVNVLGAFNKTSQQQSVNNSLAAGTIGSSTNPFFGDEYVRGTLYEGIGSRWVGPIANPFGASNISDVAFGNGVYVAVAASGKIARSIDNGATWGALIVNNFGGAEQINSVAFGGGVFVAVSLSGNTSYSTDNGVTWSALVSPVGGTNLQSVAFGNGVFVSVGAGGKIIYSTNLGVSWSIVASPPFGGAIANCVSFGNGMFVAGSNGAPGIIAYSKDLGITWTVSTHPFTGSVNAISFGNGIFVAGGAAGQIARSVDLGKTWGSLVTNPLSNTVESASYNFGIFQLCTSVGTTARSYDNGVSWGSLVTNPFGSFAIRGIASGSINLVAVGDSATIATAGWNAALSVIDGSNANGNFLQYSDGTQVCWFTDTNTLTTSNAYGAFWDITQAYTFPKAFISAPTVMASGLYVANTFISALPTGILTTGFTWVGVGFNNNAQANPSYLAIGKYM